ncbi:hypothetical protein ACFE35_26145 [Phormidesmis priestleyi ANT.L61.2]
MSIQFNLAFQLKPVPPDHREPDFYIDSNRCTLHDAAQQLAIDSQPDTPFIIWLLEHPNSPIALPGKIDLYGHDCLHNIPIARSRYPEKLTSTGMIAFTRFSTEDILRLMKPLSWGSRWGMTRKPLGCTNFCISLLHPLCIPKNTAFRGKTFNPLMPDSFTVDRYSLET